jgi:hypothetical protein
MSLNELQVLLAHAASPKVRPESVSIAKSNLQQMDPLGTAKSGGDHGAPMDWTWLYWVGGAGAAVFLLVLLLSLGKGGGGVSGEEFQETHRELAQLRDLAYQQQAQLQATQQQTQMLLEAQQRVSVAPPMTSGVMDSDRQISGGGLEQTLTPTLQDLRETLSSEELDDEDLSLQIKNWIESS